MTGLTSALFMRELLMCGVLKTPEDAKTDYLSRKVLNACPPLLKVSFVNHAPGGKIDLLKTSVDAILVVSVKTYDDSIWQLTDGEMILAEWKGSGTVYVMIRKDKIMYLRHMNKQNDSYYVSVLPIAIRGDSDDD